MFLNKKIFLFIDFLDCSIFVYGLNLNKRSLLLSIAVNLIHETSDLVNLFSKIVCGKKWAVAMYDK